MERALRIVWPAGAVAGLALVAWWPVNSRVAAAQLFAVAGTLLVTRLLFATGRERPVALRPFTYGDDQKVEAAGLEVPAEALSDEQVQKGVDYELQRGLFFRGLFLGKDGRWSTSKLQVLLWTYAVVFALSSIFLAAALGVDEGLDSLIDIDDEHWDIYLLLLGGPFAAMVLARGITETKVENETVAKTQSEPTTNVGPGSFRGDQQ